MNRRLAIIHLAAGVAWLSIAVAPGQVQPLPAGHATDLKHATDFTSDSYFEPPHEQQVKFRLSGAEALPLPGGLLDVKKMQIETFSVNGKLEMVVSAPQCTLAPMEGGWAKSAGHLELRSGDGRFRVDGDGFLWRQNESSLTISNRVRTVIEMPK